MSLPPNWATTQQPAPNNLPAEQRAVRLLEQTHACGKCGIPLAMRPDGSVMCDRCGYVTRPTMVEGPLRRFAGPLLADAAIARAEIGREQYGSYVTRNNGRSHAVDALQELADAAAYIAAWWDELPADSDERPHVANMLIRINDAAMSAEIVLAMLARKEAV